MNRSTFCEIRYMKKTGGGGVSSKTGYMIGVSFKILICTPLPTLPRAPPPPPPPPSLKLFTFCLCKLSAMIFLLQVVLVMLNG